MSRQIEDQLQYRMDQGMSKGNRPVEGFIAELNKAWRAAGPPTSFAAVEKLSNKITMPVDPSGLKVMTLADSTTHAILSGQRRGLPKWPWVASLITVLRAAAAQAGLNPMRVGTLEEWKVKYDAAVLLLEQGDQELAPELVEELEEARVPAARSAVCQREGCLVLAAPATPRHLTLRDSQEDAQRGSVLTLVKQIRTLDWWHDFRDVVPDWFEIYLSLESAAHQIRTYETQYIPGLLQTPEYAEALIRSYHGTAAQEKIKRALTLRVRRQQILHGPNPTRLWAIMDEAVLQRPVGSPEMMRGQIRHLLYMSKKPNITVQILPSGPRAANDQDENTSVHDAAGGPITILRFSQSELPDVVYLEQQGNALYPDKPSDVHHYVQVFTRLGIEAEKRAPTIEILRRILTDL